MPKDPEATRTAVRKALDSRHSDLDELLDRQIVILEYTQEALRNELTRGLSPDKPRYITEDDSKKLDALTKGLAAAVRSKIQLETHYKKAGEGMTPSELLEAAINKIRGLPASTRAVVLAQLAEYHETQEVLPARGVSMGTALDAVRNLGPHVE